MVNMVHCFVNIMRNNRQGCDISVTPPLRTGRVKIHPVSLNTQRAGTVWPLWNFLLNACDNFFSIYNDITGHYRRITIKLNWLSDVSVDACPEIIEGLRCTKSLVCAYVSSFVFFFTREINVRPVECLKKRLNIPRHWYQIAFLQSIKTCDIFQNEKLDHTSIFILVCSYFTVSNEEKKCIKFRPGLCQWSEKQCHVTHTCRQFLYKLYAFSNWFSIIIFCLSDI